MRYIVLLFLGSIITQFAMAQNMRPHEYAPPPNPATDYYKQQLTDQVLQQLNKIDWAHVDRTTSSGTALYTIPVVVHVLHNYGLEIVADTTIYNLIKKINTYFLKTNPDTVTIIDKFKPVAASTQIAFKMATIDPVGNPTKGIEHIYTYLTYNAADESKVNQWPQQKYLNIWIINNFSSSAGSDAFGYAYSPISASYYPYYDGIVLSYQAYLLNPQGNIDARYFARYLNLANPCNAYTGTGGCVDNDMIADTPPCNESGSCSNIYDTTCDTPNNQNIMSNYDTCGIMFTYGQGQYMQYVLQLDFGNRDSLIATYNYSAAGMGNATPDMLPVADFSVGNNSFIAAQPRGLYRAGEGVLFKNESWNDTITKVRWTFSNNANISIDSSFIGFYNEFHAPGWVTVSLAATGNNTGTTTLVNDHALFIVDSIPTQAAGYEQQFNPGTGMDKWPIFNYYHNTFQWQLANVGYNDNSSLEYTGFDFRAFPENMTGTAQGDIDDIYTPAFDLTAFSASCYLNFMTSGATIRHNINHMNDSLEIDYSTNASSWQKLKVLNSTQLFNKGTVITPYTPSSQNDWVAHAISLPSAARTAYTLFRIRYYPGTADSAGIGFGNNFYLDDFNFGQFPESVKNIDRLDKGISLLPNPTQGNTVVVIKDDVPVTAQITVMDIAGRVVYEHMCHSNATTASIEIPANVIAEKGLYLVHVVTSTINETKKLIAY